METAVMDIIDKRTIATTRNFIYLSTLPPRLEMLDDDNTNQMEKIALLKVEDEKEKWIESSKTI